ncbi:MAG: hypothetical protein ACI3X1_06615 [Eubacteriales bacterium]
MKKGDILFGTALRSVYMLGSCIVIMFAEMLAIKIIDLFVGLSPLSLCIVRALIYTVGVNALLAIVSYKEGYRSASFSAVGTLISGALASLLHFLVSLLFSFEAFCSGGVKFITALVKFGASLNSESFSGSLSRFDCIPFFFANALVYIAVMIIFGRLGARNRLRDREELTGNK